MFRELGQINDLFSLNLMFAMLYFWAADARVEIVSGYWMYEFASIKIVQSFRFPEEDEID
jgi:hypothetical protein